MSEEKREREVDYLNLDVVTHMRGNCSGSNFLTCWTSAHQCIEQSIQLQRLRGRLKLQREPLQCAGLCSTEDRSPSSCAAEFEGVD